MIEFWVLSPDNLSRNISDFIRDRARELGIEIGDMNKFEVIREIQKREGFTQCFGTSPKNCPHTNCAWYQDCKGNNE